MVRAAAMIFEEIQRLQKSGGDAVLCEELRRQYEAATEAIRSSSIMHASTTDGTVGGVEVTTVDSITLIDKGLGLDRSV
eukprot:SAG31_NODE_267_length_18790_cov_3.661655_3_plen_79_part_00